MIPKLISFVKSNQQPIFWGICGILLLFISFNIGRIYAFQKTAILVKEENEAAFFEILDLNDMNLKEGSAALVKNTNPPKPKDLRVVVSKNSNKYHFAWCSGAKRIKEENQIWFNSAKEAETAGYILAGNCLP